MPGHHRIRTVIVAAIGAMAAGSAWAGPDWEEGALDTGDAGSLPGDAQVPRGQPPLSDLNSISGLLEGGAITVTDIQDMYLIYIQTPSAFFAVANAPVEGGGGLDTQLWLFDVDGLGILGNDGTGLSSGFGNEANDGSNARVAEPGLYYLAISPFDSDPVNSAGAPLFNQSTPGEVSGPDGSGGSSPIAGWSGATGQGAYTIVLGGAVFVPCEGDASGDGLVDVDDLTAVILAWGTSDPSADLDGSGIVDVDDLVLVILSWGECVADGSD